MKKAGGHYRSLYFYILVSGLIFLTFPLAAQVNEEEIRDYGPVEFISYEGPHTRIETRAQIRNIGYQLGLLVYNGNLNPGTPGRYFVIKTISEPVENKLDADIFGLGADVGVDHIRNLRLIIQGYLEGAYRYSERDAALLAEYVTIYNAVFRGDWTYFSSRYKDPVMDHLTREKAGLSIRYDEWPGQTLMLIPMGIGRGGPLSVVDTPTLLEPEVIEFLRQEPDMGIEIRKEIVELIERQAEEAIQEAVIIREVIRQEEVRIAEERQEARQQVQEARQEIQQIAQERRQPEADQQALDRRQEAAQQQVQEALERQEELDEQEEALEELKEEAEEQEAFAEELIEQAQEQRQQIAEDLQSIIMREQPPEGGILGVAILNTSSNLGRLVLLGDSGDVTKQSEINTVNARTVNVYNNRVFAIAGEARGNGAAIRLVEMTPDTLEMIKQGADDISAESLLWRNGQDFYAITSTGGNLNLARFNADLILQNRSEITVHPFASLVFIGGYIATQRTDGSAVLLNPIDLTER